MKKILVVISLVVVGSLLVVNAQNKNGNDSISASVPVDLGMDSTEEDLATITYQLGKNFIDPIEGVNPNDQLLDSESVEVDERFTEAGFSRHIEKVHPIKDVQVKFTEGGFEMSGIIERDRIQGLKDTLGISDSELKDIEFAERIIDVLKDDPAFYLKGYGSVANNVVDIEIDSATIAGRLIPEDKARDALKKYLELVFERAPAFNGEAITIQPGYLDFVGTATAEVPIY